MTTVTTSPEVAASAVVAAMERAWQAIRAHHREAPEVIVVLGAGSEARRGLFKLGHFAAARWHVNGHRRAEVLVSGEGLRRGAVDVLGTLLHEAAHGLADTRGVKDTSRQGRYHNRHYARLASEVGLEVARDPATGWSQTTVPDQLAQVYAAVLAGLAAALGLWRYAEQQHPTQAGSRNLLACTCGCGRKLRVAKATLEQAPIWCGACEEAFEPVDAYQAVAQRRRRQITDGRRALRSLGRRFEWLLNGGGRSLDELAWRSLRQSPAWPLGA
jgi:hypothetical protein